MARRRGQGSGAPGALAEHLLEELLVEADENGLALANGWRAQVAGRTEHGFDQILAGLATGELACLLALGDEYFRCGLGERCRVRLRELAARRDDLLRFDASGVQKIGRSGARRSALAVVVPVDRLRHRQTSLASDDQCTGCVCSRHVGARLVTVPHSCEAVPP